MEMLLISVVITGIVLIGYIFKKYNLYLLDLFGISVINKNIIFSALAFVTWYLAMIFYNEAGYHDLNCTVAYVICAAFYIVSLYKNIRFFRVLHGIIVSVLHAGMSILIIVLLFIL